MAMEHPFLRNEMLWGPEAQRRLAAAHVILFGLGGVGSYTAECLARAGIGELTIVDSDTVSLTNLNRQLEALHSTLGQPKAEAVGQRLLDINPNLKLHAIHGLYDAVHREEFFPAGCRYDYAVDAIDLVSCKLDLAETALRLQIPLIAALGTDQFPRIRVGVGKKPHPDYDLADWVLGKFQGEDRKAIAAAVERCADAVECYIKEGPDRAMNKFNG